MGVAVIPGQAPVPMGDLLMPWTVHIGDEADPFWFWLNRLEPIEDEQ